MNTINTAFVSYKNISERFVPVTSGWHKNDKFGVYLVPNADDPAQATAILADAGEVLHQAVIYVGSLRKAGWAAEIIASLRSKNPQIGIALYYCECAKQHELKVFANRMKIELIHCYQHSHIGIDNELWRRAQEVLEYGPDVFYVRAVDASMLWMFE